MISLIRRNKNAILYVLGDFLQISISGFILLPYYLRILTIDEYAEYGVFTTVLTAFTYVLQFGLISAFFRGLYESDNDENKLRSLIVVIHIGVLAIVSVGVFVVYISSSYEINIISHIIPLFLSVLLFSNNMYFSILRYKSEVNKYFGFQLFVSLLNVVLIFYFVEVFESALLAIVLSLFVANFCVSIASYKNIVKGFEFDYHYIKQNAYKVFSFSFPVFLTYVIYFFYLRFNLLLVDYYSSTAEVAIFTLALQISAVVMIFSGALGKYFQPLIFLIDREFLSTELAKKATNYKLILFSFSLLLALGVIFS